MFCHYCRIANASLIAKQILLPRKRKADCERTYLYGYNYSLAAYTMMERPEAK